MKKNFFICAMAVLMAFIWSIPTNVFAANTPNAHNTAFIQSELNRASSQKRQLAANEILMQSFFVKGKGMVYPDWYSSCYIEGDYLYVCIVSGSSITEESLNKLFGKYSDAVKYEYRPYSLNELKKISNEYAGILLDKGCELTEYSIDDFTGDLSFSVKETSKVAAEKLLSTANTYSRSGNRINVNIEVSNEIETQVDVYCGAPLGTSSTRSNHTLGVFGIYNGTISYATCGHMTSAGVGDNIYYNGTSSVIGTMVRKQYTNNGSGDYSIVSVNNGFMPTNRMGTSSDYIEIESTMLIAPAGAVVIKYGKSGGFATAHVLTTNTTFVDTDTGSSTMVIYGISKAELLTGQSLKGDSGGPYVVSGNAFCGTHTGYGSGYVYYSQYQNLAIVGFTPYCG